MLKFFDNSFGELAQHTVSCIDELTRKIVIHDNEPTFDRLRRGDFASQLDPSFGDAEVRLAEYDRSICLMEEALLKLKSARAGFKWSVDVSLSLCAPIRSLPKDILVEIFMIYIEGFSNSDSFGASSRTYGVTLSSKYRGSGFLPRISSPNFSLSHICSFWRKVVFSNPTFWSSLSLDLGAFEGHKKECILSFLSERLSLSKQAPLNLDLKLADEPDCLSQERALPLLLKQVQRWERLSLRYSKTNSIWPLLTWFKSTDQPPVLPSLKHVVLHFSSASERPLRLPSIFIRNTHLETLSAEYFKLSWADLCQSNVLSIKKLSGVYLSDASFGQFLSRMPSLETCILTTTGLTVGTEPLNISHYSSLRHLSVSYISCPIKTWQTIRLPLLTHLSVDVLFDDTPEITVEAISSMLLRSKATLQSVELHQIFAREAINFIDAHPSLINVTVTGYCQTKDGGQYPGDLLPRLTISQGSDEPILGPNLQSFTAKFCKHFDEEYSTYRVKEDLVKLVQSRADANSLPPGVAVLREVSLLLGAERRQEVNYIRNHLEPLVASGLGFHCTVDW
ncbi:hypothetical protein GYMLUDRAFT_34762 [Collybiopsis luxurians FD-317 M1]|nr:hypothetical protein GYMLUDRAFT_34762 [Collybiopsis luxurians FD-317 M1]